MFGSSTVDHLIPQMGVTSTLNLSSPVTLVQHRSWWSRRASKDLQLKLIFILLQLGPNYPYQKQTLRYQVFLQHHPLVNPKKTIPSPATLNPWSKQRRVLVAVQFPNAAILCDGHCIIQTLTPKKSAHLVGLLLVVLRPTSRGKKVVFAKLSTPWVGSLSCNKK